MTNTIDKLINQLWHHFNYTQVDALVDKQVWDEINNSKPRIQVLNQVKRQLEEDLSMDITLTATQ
jgi:hypothetical protein